MATINKNEQERGLWEDIWDVLNGVEKDYTSGSLGKALILLSLPMVFEMMMESIFAIADIYFVSKLGASAIATVGITESLITLIYAVALGISMATTALISRRIGEKKPNEAATTAVQAIYTGIVMSTIIAIPGVIYYKELLQLMGMTNFDYSSYAAIMLGGNMTIMLLFVINAVFRSAGNAVISMYVLIFANVLNLLLDPLLIFGFGPVPAFGIEGAAIATTIGRGSAVILQLYLLFTSDIQIKLKEVDLRPRFNLIFRILRLSAGGVLQYIIATSSWVAIMRILALFGDQVVAGYTIAIRLIVFSLLPSWGISNAAATLVGQNLGAKKPERAEKSVWLSARINAVIMGILGAILFIGAVFWVSFFTEDPSVLKSGVAGLQIVSYGFVFYGFGMVIVNSFNGAGDTYTPTFINLACFWLFEIPLAYWLAIEQGWGENGVFYSIPIAETMVTIAAVLFFRRGKWKTKEV